MYAKNHTHFYFILFFVTEFLIYCILASNLEKNRLTSFTNKNHDVFSITNIGNAASSQYGHSQQP
jgi:hypothetical protein